MNKANRKLQHNMSAVHQKMDTEARVLEKYLKHYKIEHKELWDTVNVLKEASNESKRILNEHYSESESS